MKNKLLKIALSTLIISCSQKTDYDASGTFEATETIISAQADGAIEQLSIIEGQSLEAGVLVGKIDSVQLSLKKKQLDAQIGTIESRKYNIDKQTAFFDEQKYVAETNLSYLLNELKRTKNLIAADAATTKQLDEISNKVAEARRQINIIEKQKQAQISALQTQNTSTSSEEKVISAQIDQVTDLLSKSKIINPIKGTILTKYVENDEVVIQGKPLYKIADLSTLILRTYISGNQFDQVKIGQKVKVSIGSDDLSKVYDGTINWISDKAEFTPKTIQTKDERANLVYAIKISVPNDGQLKIGMYGDVKF